jgi:hypothetical protein
MRLGCMGQGNPLTVADPPTNAAAAVGESAKGAGQLSLPCTCA